METEDMMRMGQLINQLTDLLAAQVAVKMQTQLKDVWTVAELAERYGVSRDTIRRRIVEGEFGEPLNLGRRTHRVTAEGVRKYDAAHSGAMRRADLPARRRKKAVPAGEAEWI